MIQCAQFLKKIRFMTRWMAFVSVGVGATQRILLSVLARNPHKGLAREISHETGRERGKQGPRAVERRRQNRAVDRREQSVEVGGSRLLGCVDPEAGFSKVRGCVCVPGDFVGISLEYTLTLPHRYYLPNPSARVGYDTRSIFKRSLTDLNLEFSFS